MKITNKNLDITMELVDSSRSHMSFNKTTRLFEACIEINDVKVLVTNARLKQFDKIKESSNVRVINNNLVLLDFISSNRNSKSLMISNQKIYFYIDTEEYSDHFQCKITVEVWEKQQ